MAELTREEFIKFFPVFEDVADFVLSYRLNVANLLFDEKTWGREMMNHAAALYVAHFSYLEKNAATGAATSGVVSSKSVDGASVSFDTGSGMEQGAGFWNLSPYGRELFHLFQIFGAGGRQI